MLLLDAYNVLHCSHVLPDRYAMVDPAGLCQLIRRSGLGDRGAVIVCDGAPKPHEAPDDGGEGVDLVYAGPGRDADTLLEQMIARNSAPRHLRVVSNDRRIRAAARRRRATVLDSEAFLRDLAQRLQRVVRPPTLDEKPMSPDTEEWIRKFGVDEDFSDDPTDDTRHWMRMFGYEDDAVD